MEPAMGTDPMRLALYKAAVEGKPQDYYKALRRQTAAVEDNGLQVMPNGNTVLHVAALRGHENFVGNILDGKLSSSLLFAQNKKQKTALHCAAEKGYDNIVSILIQKSKDVESGTGETRRMIEMRDNVMDTALHKAVRMGHLEVVKKLLVGEGVEFVYPANNAGETPIYIAARLGFRDCLQQLLDICENPAFGGPLGRNALHATVLLSIPGCTELLLLEKGISLCEMTDDSGWTPLHYAIKMGDNKTARMILERNSSAAYIWPRKGRDEWTTVFHIAARYGNIGMMKYISNRFPDCWMMLNTKCQNVLHEAVLSHRLNVIKYVLKYPQINNLIYEEDEDGNTPLDVLFICSCNPLKRVVMEGLMWKNYLVFNKQHQTPFENRNWAFSKHFLGLIWKHSLVFNKQHQTPFENRNWACFTHFLARKLVRKGGKIGSQGDVTEKPKEMKKDGMKEHISLVLETSKANIIGATLILTVTFAGCYTVPGGYDSNPGKTQGMPILLSSFAFQSFAFFDCIAFIWSILSIFFHMVMVTEASSTKNFKVIKKYFGLSADMIVFAAISAVGAFTFGMSATLAPLPPLAYAVLTLGGFCGLGIIYLSVTKLNIHNRIFGLFKTS